MTAQEIAEALRERATELGATAAVVSVLVPEEDGKIRHYTAWTGGQEAYVLAMSGWNSVSSARHPIATRHLIEGVSVSVPSSGAPLLNASGGVVGVGGASVGWGNRLAGPSGGGFSASGLSSGAHSYSSLGGSSGVRPLNKTSSL